MSPRCPNKRCSLEVDISDNSVSHASLIGGLGAVGHITSGLYCETDKESK